MAKSKKAVQTTAKAEVLVHDVHTPFNAPKPNSISQACMNLAEITAIALNGDGKLSKFGHMAHRIYQHVDWCANDATSHGTFLSRLEKVGMAAFKEAIAMNLKELATMLKNTYDVQYAKLYRDRKKGLLPVAA